MSDRERRHGGGGSNAGAVTPSRRLLVMLALIVALLWQGFVTQTHRHVEAAPTPAWSSGHDAGATLTAHRDPFGHHTTACRICDEIAQAGHYVPPAIRALVAAIVVVAWVRGSRISASLVRPHRHGWRSRAPPRPLRT